MLSVTGRSPLSHPFTRLILPVSITSSGSQPLLVENIVLVFFMILYGLHMHEKKGILALRVCNTNSLYSIRRSTEVIKHFFKGSTLFFNTIKRTAKTQRVSLFLQKTVERSVFRTVKIPSLKIHINTYHFDITQYLFVKPFLKILTSFCEGLTTQTSCFV